jgi:CheY-like chemotaxis protein
MHPNLGHVLVLEDEPFISLDMEEMLRELGATSVTTFDTRTDALKWLEGNRPDLAVVDPRLNDGVCADVAEYLVGANVPFMVYSGADVEESVFQKGGWLDKPTMPETLQEALEKLLR